MLMSFFSGTAFEDIPKIAFYQLSGQSLAQLTYEINYQKSTSCQFYSYTHLLKPQLTSNRDNNKVLIPPNM